MVQIPLYQKGHKRATVYAWVDDTDAAHIQQWRWYLVVMKQGQRVHHYAHRYERIGGRSRPISMHRQIMGLPAVGGELEADHINHNGLDNQRSNLRAVSHAQNQQNKRRNLHASSQFRGVYWEKKSSKWRARVRLAGGSYHLGYFIEEEDAALVAADWRKQHMPFATEVA